MGPIRKGDQPSGTDGVVLVHGGFHGAWCWADVLPLIERPAVAVDLPGRGARPAAGERVTFSRCVDAVLDDADRAGFDRFLLVGHSLGGLTIAATANRVPARVARLVYLAALAPRAGQTLFDFCFPEGAAPEVQDPAGVQPLFDKELGHRMYCGDLDDAAFADVYSRCVPEAYGLFIEKVSGYSHAPATYVRCRRDAAIPPELTEAGIANVGADEVIEIDSDHDAMLSHPAEVAAMINHVAGRS